MKRIYGERDLLVAEAQRQGLWTSLDALPFDEMWADDIHWLAQTLIERRRFMGRFTFDDDTMLSHEVKWL